MSKQGNDSVSAEDAIPNEEENAPAPDGAERRVGARHISVLINAGISHQGDDALCRIRNLSSGGVMIESPLPLAVDDIVGLHLRSGQNVGGLVRWVREAQAGIAFDDPAGAEKVSAPAPVVRRTLRKQVQQISPIGHPLFRRKADALLSSGQVRIRAPIVLISPTGLIVEKTGNWGTERLYSVQIEGLGRYQARLTDTIVAEDAENVGLLFVEPVLYRTFNDWMLATPRWDEDNAPISDAAGEEHGQEKHCN